LILSVPKSVTPAQVGVQMLEVVLDSRLRGNDKSSQKSNNNSYKNLHTVNITLAIEMKKRRPGDPTAF